MVVRTIPSYSLCYTLTRPNTLHQLARFSNSNIMSDGSDFRPSDSDVDSDSDEEVAVRPVRDISVTMAQFCKIAEKLYKGEVRTPERVDAEPHLRGTMARTENTATDRFRLRFAQYGLSGKFEDDRGAVTRSGITVEEYKVRAVNLTNPYVRNAQIVRDYDSLFGVTNTLPYVGNFDFLTVADHNNRISAGLNITIPVGVSLLLINCHVLSALQGRMHASTLGRHICFF